jgi:hypothetical protein
MKRCTDCKQEKPTTEFNINCTRKDGLQTRCTECNKRYAKRYQAAKVSRFGRVCRRCGKSKPLEEFALFEGIRKRICKGCNSKKVHKLTRRQREYSREYQQKIKAEVIQHYGSVCACCSENRLIFLVIDHINGGGNKEHNKVGHGTSFYRWLKKQEYPSGYQVLCHNCNFAKHMGVCPHVIEKSKDSIGE